MTRKTQPVRVLESPVNPGRFYALTRYTVDEQNERFIAEEKHDVTEDVQALLAVAYARGAFAKAGDLNPYQPIQEEAAGG